MVSKGDKGAFGGFVDVWDRALSKEFGIGLSHVLKDPHRPSARPSSIARVFRF